MATAFPPGFRFHPTDVELVCYYLKRKLMGKHFQFEAISEVDLYKFAPWDLPAKFRLRTKDLVWYFFCPRDKKYSNGSRMNRSTDIGYWKTTGKDRPIIHISRTIGFKKTLIFHVGKPPKGNRTDWVMYEYIMDDKQLVNAGSMQDAYVLCKVFQKSGPGPKIGEQYGAPFCEDDWDNDPTECSFSLPHLSCARPKVVEPDSVHPFCEQPSNDGVQGSSNNGFTDVDGMFVAELEEFFNDPVIENSVTEMFDSALIQVDNREASVVEVDALYSELKDLSASEIITAGSYYPRASINENPLHPVLSELVNDQYAEIDDDVFLPGEFISFESFVDNGYLINPQALDYSRGGDIRNVYDQNHFSDDFVTTNNEGGTLDALSQFTSEDYALQIDDYHGLVA